jgi:glycosyltransferase involved in cell wall biosynthesis
MKNPIRIFHLIKGLGRGGAETLLNEGFSFIDHERFLCTYGYFLPWKNALVSSLQNKGAEVICFNRKNALGMMMSVPAIAKLLHEKKVDMVHCHLPLAGIAGRLAARFSRIPVIYTEHNVMERYHPWTRRANLWSWKLQKAVVAVSEEVKSSILAHAGNSVPVTVVPNGIPVDSFSSAPNDRADSRERSAIPAKAPVIGTVAVFRKQKDLPTWLRAARLIRDRYPDTHFLIVGDGPLKADAESIARSLRLDNVVHFPGIQENVKPYYAAMDIYMNSSIFEGLPLSLLEAMAMKLPVVATEVGGMPEVIINGKTGFLVPPHSPEALAKQICLLLSNEEMRHQFGQEGRFLVEERFSMKRMVRQLEDLYLEFLNKREVVV